MSNTQTPKPWNYNPPKTCKTGEKLFALQAQKPFFGKRINKAKLTRMLSQRDFKRSMGLADLATPIPTTWSWRQLGNTTYKGKIESPRDQGQCGCCWAFATTMSLGDRYSIKYKIPSPMLSPTYLMTGTYDLMQTAPQDSCNNGGDPYQAGQWLESNGNKQEKCWPFTIIANHNWVSPNPLPKNCCATCCGSQIQTLANTNFGVQPNSTHSLVVTNNNGSVNSVATIAAIQRDIMTNGPVICGFQVYNDFMDYWNNSAPRGGIYVCSDSSDYNLDGGHAVCITGWGVGKVNGKTVRYWELRNSWGTYTGDGGYGKVAFSIDVPANAPMQMDIPQEQQGGEWSGGMISVMPAALPAGYKPSLEGFEYGAQGSTIISCPPCDCSLTPFTIVANVIVIIIFVLILLWFINVINDGKPWKWVVSKFSSTNSTYSPLIGR